MKYPNIYETDRNNYPSSKIAVQLKSSDEKEHVCSPKPDSGSAAARFAQVPILGPETLSIVTLLHRVGLADHRVGKI